MPKDTKRRLVQPPSLPRRDWVVALHRRPTRWDVLFHELSLALIRRYWHAQSSFRSDTLRLSNDELPNVALLLSLGLSRLISTNAVGDLAGQPRPSLWDTDAARFEELLAQAGTVFRDILCSYHELTGDGWIKRNHDDLRLIVERLVEAVRHFVESKCRPGGELWPCLENPLGDDEGFFPAGNKPVDPQQTSGNSKLDAYRLNCLVHDADDADTVKSKLIDFVRADPLLAPEQGRFIGQRLVAQKERIKSPEDEFNIAYAANDDFLFNPTRQGGLTPVRLFMDAHLFLTPAQKQRLQRWDASPVTGIFRVISSGDRLVELQDLSSGRTFRVACGSAMIERFQPGSGVQTRFLPWDDGWVFSGIQKLLDLRPEVLRGMGAQLNPMNFRRSIDDDDARVTRARELTRLAGQQWQALFGSDTVVSHTLEENRGVLERFDQHLRQQALPGGETTIYQAFEKEVGIPAPQGAAAVSLEAGASFHDLALLFSGDHGLVQLADYDFVRQAIDGDGILSPEQRGAIWMYLSAPWIPAWVADSLVRRSPGRMEVILRDLLGDEGFTVESDWDRLLGHFKPVDCRLPVRPRPWL